MSPLCRTDRTRLESALRRMRWFPGNTREIRKSQPGVPIAIWSRRHRLQPRPEDATIPSAATAPAVDRKIREVTHDEKSRPPRS